MLVKVFHNDIEVDTISYTVAADCVGDSIAIILVDAKEASIELKRTVEEFELYKSQKKSRQECTSRNLYGNIKFLSLKKDLMFYGTLKKLFWYWTRGIANIIDDRTVQLMFETAGPGNIHSKVGNRDNLCVVCGCSENLNKHHVVPYQYRKWLPKSYSVRNHFDVLATCVSCHRQYETSADFFKEELRKKYDVHSGNEEVIGVRPYAAKLAHTLYLHGDKLPEERKQYFHDMISSEIPDFVFTEENLKNLSEIWGKPTRIRLKEPHGKLIVDKLDNIDDFVIMWREHFINTMNPKYLPMDWVKNKQEILKKGIL